MSGLSLQILEPLHGTGSVITDSVNKVALVGSVCGDGPTLYYKWFSSLNSDATEDHPELNSDDHSKGILHWSAPLAEFGSHVLVLAATDQDGIALGSVLAVTQSAMAGGAPPAAPLPCVIHRLKAQIRTPAEGGNLSKADALFEVLAPLPWLRESAADSGIWEVDRDYQKINGISMTLHLTPVGPPDPAHSAMIALDLASPSPTPAIRFDKKSWFQWRGALPLNLGTGNHVLTLTVTGGGVSIATTRNVVLI